MKENKLNSIIKLLDDPDESIYKALEQELIAEGTPLLDKLEQAWEQAEDPLVHERLEHITHRIQLTDNTNGFQAWAQMPKPSLIDAAYLLSKYQYPSINETEFKEMIIEIGDDIIEELNPHLTPLEQIKVVNHIFYRVYRFERPKNSMSSTQWFFVNNLLSERKGNDYSLCLLYAAVAQYAGLPVYGLHIPDNLTLAYLDPAVEYDQFTRESPLFFINPFNRGAVFGTLEINDFLTRSKQKKDEAFYTPIHNYKLVATIMEALQSFYATKKKKLKAREMGHLIQIVEQYGQDLYND